MSSVGVIFGGRSVEHEVSVLTAQQAMAALEATDHHVVPLYISKSGEWFWGDALRELDAFSHEGGAAARATRVDLRLGSQGLHVVGSSRGLWGHKSTIVATIDLALPLVHGTFGEDGCLAGLFELAGIPYVGCGVSAAAISMDKLLTKTVLAAAGIPVVPCVALPPQWRSDFDRVLKEVSDKVPYPLYLKPSNLGSSVGVARVTNDAELKEACEVAWSYAPTLMAEPAQDDCVEINCAVMRRDGKAHPSASEEIVSTGFLSYEDKYMGGAKKGKKVSTKGMSSASRIIPAPVDEATTNEIARIAVAAYEAIGASGITRVDLLVAKPHNGNPARVIVNELNTVPGSLAFYLWEKAGFDFPQLLEAAFAEGMARATSGRSFAYSIDSWLLSGVPAGIKS